jgi:glycosyltransferase involved in cell wall biosynthesis
LAAPEVVVALTQPPTHEGGANARCALALLRGLVGHGVGVRAVCPSDESAARIPDTLRDRVEVVEAAAGSRRRRSPLRRVRRPIVGLAEGPFLTRVHALAQDADLLHLDQLETAWCAAGTATPSLVYFHYRIRMDVGRPLPWRREFHFLAERTLAERALLRRQRHLVVNSPVVADSVRAQAPHAEVHVVPLCLDPEHYEPAALADPPVLGIVGTGWWPPTAAAMRRLVTRTWPLIRAQRPSARLLVAGRGTEALGLPPTPGVEVLGPVPSGAAFLRRLSGLIYPLERGSGMKVKVLEALASGVPVVTTVAGAEGVDGGDGVAVAETDPELARAAVALLDDAVERRQRGAAARAAFLRRYAPGPATEPLVELYARMANA